MTESKAEEFAAGVIRVAMENFRRDGHVIGLALIPTAHAMLSVTLDDFTAKHGGELGKRMFGKEVRKIIDDGDVNMVAMVVESWVGKLDLNDIPDNVDPQDYINQMREEYGQSLEDWPAHLRSEQIMVSVETRDGEQLGYMVPIDSETRELSEPEKIPTEGMTGRFTSWFSPLPPTAHVTVPRKDYN